VGKGPGRERIAGDAQGSQAGCGAGGGSGRVGVGPIERGDQGGSNGVS
jgi:hypothetical protein